MLHSIPATQSHLPNQLCFRGHFSKSTSKCLPLPRCLWCRTSQTAWCPRTVPWQESIPSTSQTLSEVELVDVNCVLRVLQGTGEWSHRYFCLKITLYMLPSLLYAQLCTLSRRALHRPRNKDVRSVPRKYGRFGRICLEFQVMPRVRRGTSTLQPRTLHFKLLLLFLKDQPDLQLFLSCQVWILFFI